MQEQSHFLLQLKSYLISQWKQFGLSGSPAGLTYRIRQTPHGRAIDRSRLVALWFHDNPEKPQVVTKWVLNKNFASFIVQEHRHAQWLYEKKKHRFIPRPLACTEILGMPVLIEEAVLGRSFAHQILSLPFGRPNGEATIEATFQTMFERAGEILSKIQDPLRPIPKKDFLQYFEPYVSRTQTILEWNTEKRKKIDAVLQSGISDPVSGSGKTMIVGDFAPQNILEGKKGLFLIDLEFSLESPSAFLDPLAFVYSLFRFSVPDFWKKEPDEVVKLFVQDLLEGKSGIAPLAHKFMISRKVSKEHLLWYWLVFFIHETTFQNFLSEAFPPNHRKLLDGIIATLLQRLEKSGSSSKRG